MKASELLSIFLPTFRRVQYLQECLDSIVPQVKKYGIKIHISNSESNDSIKSIVDSYEYAGLIYHDHIESLGNDGNLMRVFDYADSKYCYMLGDDDIVFPGGVDKIIEVLSKEEYDFLILNGRYYRVDFDNLIRRHLDISKSEVVTDPSHLLRTYWGHMPYSTLVINMDRAKDLDYSRFIGTSHAYSSIPVELFASKRGLKRALIMVDEIVGLREGEKIWKKELAEILLVQVPMWIDLLSDPYKDDIDFIKSRYFLSDFKYTRLLKFFNFKDIEYEKFRNVPPFIWKRISLIKKIPFFLRNIICQLMSLLKKIRDYTNSTSS